MRYKIFQIDTSENPTSNSYTRRIGQHFIRKFQEKFGQLEVSYLDLQRQNPSYHYIKSLCDSNIWLWGLSEKNNEIPDNFQNWLQYMKKNSFNITTHCSFKSQNVVIVLNLKETEDILHTKCHSEPLLRQQLQHFGIENPTFFYISKSDNSPTGEIRLQNDINNYIASLHL